MIYSIEQIQREAKGHFFDKSTMNFFNSRILSDVYQKNSWSPVYFITSERKNICGYLRPRKYTVRVFDQETKHVKTAPECPFNELTKDQAIKLAKELVK